MKVSTVTTHALIVVVIVILTCPISKVKRQIGNGEKKNVFKSDGCSGLKYGKNLK